MKGCSGLAVLAFVAFQSGPEAPTPKKATSVVSDVVVIEGQTVTVSSADVAGKIRVVAAGGEFLAALPEGAGEVTEIRAARWMERGMAVAVETVSGGKRSYFWGTFFTPKPPGSFGTIVRDVEDHDLLAVVNSMGDSIYVVLTRHSRSGEDAVTGYAYVNNCPVGPDVPGALLKLTSSAK